MVKRRRAKVTAEPIPIREQLLRAFGVDPVRWARRFGLVPFTCPCSGCGAPRTTTIPCASGTFRGLIAPVCPCGSDDTPYCVVRDPRVGDLFTVLP